MERKAYCLAQAELMDVIEDAQKKLKHEDRLSRAERIAVIDEAISKGRAVRRRHRGPDVRQLTNTFFYACIATKAEYG